MPECRECAETVGVYGGLCARCRQRAVEESKCYGVWINVGDDLFLGTVVDFREEVEAAVLALCAYDPGEGDNLIIFNAGTGERFATFDVDNQEWQAE